MDKHSIFIVDDDKFLLDMYAIKFKEHSYDVKTAPNAKEALSILSKGDYAPEVFITDIVMPEMDGLELLTEIKKKNLLPSTTCVILSNLGQKEDIDKGVALGIDGYIIKASCTPTEVTNKVAEILAKKSKA